jgi:hypothetical protein
MIKKSTSPNGKLLQMEFLRDPYLGPCFFSYMLMTYQMQYPILYADDTSLIITNSDNQMFEKNLNTAIFQLTP